jgi:hypothetical protein
MFLKVFKLLNNFVILGHHHMKIHHVQHNINQQNDLIIFKQMLIKYELKQKNRIAVFFSELFSIGCGCNER